MQSLLPSGSSCFSYFSTAKCCSALRLSITIGLLLVAIFLADADAYPTLGQQKPRVKCPHKQRGRPEGHSTELRADLDGATDLAYLASQHETAYGRKILQDSLVPPNSSPDTTPSSPPPPSPPPPSPPPPSPDLTILTTPGDIWVTPTTYNPINKDWASVVSACKAVCAVEKRLCSWILRTAAHDSLDRLVSGCADGTHCGGADGSVFTEAELSRPENSYKNFGRVTAFMMRKIAALYGVSSSDALAVCGAAASSVFGGPNILRSRALRVGRRDTNAPNPGRQLLAPHAPVAAWLDHFKGRNFTIAEAAALMGTHFLIDNQACLRPSNATVSTYCNPETEACNDVRMYTWSTQYYLDVCTPSITVATAGTPTEGEDPLDVKLCPFTSEKFRQFARTDPGPIKADFNGGLAVSWVNPSSPPCSEDSSLPRSIRKNCPHVEEWFYTPQDAMLGQVCQDPSSDDSDRREIRRQMRRFHNLAVWNSVYAQAYGKMLSLGANYVPLSTPHSIIGTECFSGYVSIVDQQPCPVETCPTGRRRTKCPDACTCSTAFVNGASPNATITDWFNELVL